MGERTKYEPGTFCWADVTTTDQDGAKAFYSGLFGWEADDRPIGGGAYYSMMKVDGKDVAAISPQQEAQREAGVPPLWNSYVSVESADAVAERVGELGGAVHAPAFDVMDVGRMAVVQDPHGAFFLPWEPKLHFGAQLVNGPGLLCWNELATPDLDASGAFYADLFGWSTVPVEQSPQPYRVIMAGEANRGGMRQPDPPLPPHWAVYFGCEDVAASLARAAELGGTTLVGAMDVGMGVIGAVRDPQGAVFGLFAGQFEP